MGYDYSMTNTERTATDTPTESMQDVLNEISFRIFAEEYARDGGNPMLARGAWCTRLHIRATPAWAL